MSDTGRLNQQGSNMYGVLPCPKCGSEFRVPYQNGSIECDDCRFVEPVTGDNDADDEEFPRAITNEIPTKTELVVEAPEYPDRG